MRTCLKNHEAGAGLARGYSGFRPYLALRRRNEHYQVIAKRVCKTWNPLPRIDSGAKYRAGVVCLYLLYLYPVVGGPRRDSRLGFMDLLLEEDRRLFPRSRRAPSDNSGIAGCLRLLVSWDGDGTRSKPILADTFRMCVVTFNIFCALY